MYPALPLFLLLQSEPTDAGRLQQFKALAPEVQAAVLAASRAGVDAAADPRAQAFARVAPERARLPLESAPAVHDPRTYATGVAPDRHRLLPGDARWDAARRKYPELPVLRDLRPTARYDFGEGRCVRPAHGPTPEQILANDLNGYPRDADLALAAVLGAFDTDAARRPVARYFEHSFANLQAECFVGVTLFEVWCAGKELDIPDVDAVAFSRGILGDQSYVSPIPRGARRTALYQKITDAFVAFREYRTTREAAAAAFLCAEPDMNPTYKPLADRFHYLFARHREDPAPVAKLLAESSSRTAFLAAIDGEMNKIGAEAFAVVRKRKSAWSESAQRIRRAALAALAEVGIR